MIEFANELFDESYVDKIDLFICTIGYEERSSYLFDRLAVGLRPDNTLLFATDNYKTFENAKSKIQELSDKGYNPQIIRYQDYESAISRIRERLVQKMKEMSAIFVHVDYSSMPRSWYCRLPMLFEEILRCDDRAYFWYAEGYYSGNYRNFPTAGIDAFELFSGKPALLAQHRVHIFGVGYDFIRTQGIISIIDPEYMVFIESHDSSRTDIFENVMKANERLLSQASMTISLELADFTFMISKLCEIAYEYTNQAAAFFVPDGPKPLVLAMSLIPDLVKLPGVACLHVTRNYDQFIPVEVTASGRITGFSIVTNHKESNDDTTTPS